MNLFHHTDRRILEELHQLQGELMAIAQAILDAQAKLDAAVATNSTKVDTLIAAAAGSAGSATAAEQQTIADAIAASAAAVEATNAKS